MSHVTPEQARELAEAIMVTAKFNEAGQVIVETLRSLAAQLEAAQRDLGEAAAAYRESAEVIRDLHKVREPLLMAAGPDDDAMDVACVTAYNKGVLAAQLAQSRSVRPPSLPEFSDQTGAFITRILQTRDDAWIAALREAGIQTIPSTPDPGQFSPGPTP